VVPALPWLPSRVSGGGQGRGFESPHMGFRVDPWKMLGPLLLAVWVTEVMFGFFLSHLELAPSQPPSGLVILTQTTRH
jgi:hypothetical protein